MCQLCPYLVRHATKLQGFFIVNKDESGQPTTYNLGSYSSLGSISDIENRHCFQDVKTVLITVHGSGSTTEDYLCVPVYWSFRTPPTIFVMLPMTITTNVW
jgi:hypothetical protein